MFSADEDRAGVLARSDHKGAVRGGQGVSEEYVTREAAQPGGRLKIKLFVLGTILLLISAASLADTSPRAPRHQRHSARPAVQSRLPAATALRSARERRPLAIRVARQRSPPARAARLPAAKARGPSAATSSTVGTPTSVSGTQAAAVKRGAPKGVHVDADSTLRAPRD